MATPTPNPVAKLLHGLRNDSGQVLVMTVLLLPILLGMTGMAIDIGTYANDRRKLQNSADSAALAAARDLPDAGKATATANAWAVKNGIDLADVTVTITPVGPSNPNPKVTVEIERSHAFQFIRVLGIEQTGVGARAVAIKTTPGGVGDVTPWAVLESTLAAAGWGTTITLKYDADNGMNGNFGAIRLDGNGNKDYDTTIKNGSNSVICARGVATCQETSPTCVDEVCDSEPGNKVAGTREGTDWRMTQTAPECNEFAEVFSGPDSVTTKYVLNAACNPWLDGSYASLRVIIIPVIESLCNGRCDYTVTGFAMFWLEGYDFGKCTGNQCEIRGKFVNVDLTVNALTGVYDESASITFTKLAE